MAPERVKLFLWLVSNQAIMTNAERHRRHICGTNLCPVCKNGEETILHVLRDCPAMAGIWERIVPTNHVRAFFSESLFEWVYGNLGTSIEMEGYSWATLYAMSVW